MSTVVVRNKEAEINADHIFHGLQCSIPWPNNAISAYREHPGKPWTFYTTADVLAAKLEKMKNRLYFKRECDNVKRVPAYVWVFFCPGVGGFAYRGWWLYIKGRNINEGFRTLQSETIKKVMELFPLVQPSLFCKFSEYDEDVERWKREFVKKFPRGKWCGKPQGKSPVWAEFKNGRFVRLIERAEWPKNMEIIKC